MDYEYTPYYGRDSCDNCGKETIFNKLMSLGDGSGRMIEVSMCMNCRVINDWTLIDR